MIYAWIGAALALAGTLVAAGRAGRPGVSYYESQVYHMTRRSHLRFAAVSLVFTLLFVAGGLEPRVPSVPLLAVYTVLIVLYGASFVRGASGEDEL